MVKIISAILLLGLLGLVQAGYAEEPSPPYHELQSPLDPPAFLIVGPDHQKHSLTEYKGHIVIINFWATWCAPCLSEMPSLDSLASTLDPRIFSVIALNENSAGYIVASTYYAHHHLTHLAIYTDPTANVPNLFHFQGLPASLILDKKGKIRGYFEGDVTWTSPDIKSLLKRYSFE